ncbi:cytochrome P450, partial [Marinactinospora rubrisoli]
IAGLLALPAPNTAALTRLAPRLAPAFDAGLCPPPHPTALDLLAAIGELRDLLTDLIDTHHRHPGTGLAADLLRAAAETPTAHADALAGCLLAALSIETTANLICNAANALLDHPGQWRRLRDDPDLAPRVVEETLRHDPPIRLESRIAHTDLTLAGQHITAGSHLVICVEAANRDPAAHPDPDRFTLDRHGEPGHLALTPRTAAGLTAPLTRLLTETALRALATRLPTLRRTAPVLHRMRAPVTHGVLRFPATS